MKLLSELTPIEVEILQRFARNSETLESGIDWLASGLTPVKTATAFQLARGGRAVFQIYEDGTDGQLDDLDTEAEYYPDQSKSYPEIPTIFVVEGEL